MMSMIRMPAVMLWLIAILLFMSLTVEPEPHTIAAASCSNTDVQKALRKVTVEDTTVSIPPGTCHWTTPVTFNQAHSTTIQGAGAQTPSGGSDQTIIYDDTNHGIGGAPPALSIRTVGGKSFRLTGIAFYTGSANQTVAYNGVVGISGSSKTVRVDHNHFHIGGNGTHGLQTQGWLNGVIDHNLFDQGGNLFFIEFASPGWNGKGDPDGYGNSSWADGPNFGTGNFMFAEDNAFTGEGWAFDCITGARFVFRHNNVGTHTRLQSHGLTPDIHRACRAMEIYNNTLTYSSNPRNDNYAFVIQLESGTGLWWGNTITGFVQFLHADTVRTSKVTYPQTAPPDGWGYCGTALTGVASPWDGNTNSSGYPCIDQVGRGKGDLLSGQQFPKVVNSATGGIAWPHQASEPLYVWNNMFNRVGYTNDRFFLNDPVTQENRDYYLQLPNPDEPKKTFDGTAGIGQGLLKARPSKCTPVVGYWATDTNTLYTCTAPNSWTNFYTPYIYPHPLTSAH